MEDVICNFCHKSYEKVDNIITSDGDDPVAICENCVELCAEMIKKEKKTTEQQKGKQFNNAREIKEKLDNYVIGQEEAKRKIAVAIYKHMFAQENIKKSNVLLVGPSGVGKTELARSIADIVKVPFAITDATSLTEAGYVGEDVEQILTKLVSNADYDIEKAEKGIIYIDEIDKIARKGSNTSITRDVSGEGVQQSLLKIIEGTEVDIPKRGERKVPNEENLSINTENILFICGGSFEGLNDIVANRTSTKGVISFGEKAEAANDKIDNNVLAEDFINFGLIPELVGRIPVVSHLTDLDEDDLVNVIKLGLEQEYNAFGIHFEKEALKEIAKKAIEKKVGARGIRSIIEEETFDYIYEGQEKTIRKKEIS